MRQNNMRICELACIEQSLEDFWMTKLYLDDLRTPHKDGSALIRSYEAAVAYIKKYGVPDLISFDHDLRVDEEGRLLPTGDDFAKWLVEADLDGQIDISSTFDFIVHSQNPAGRENIKKLLEGYLRMKRS